MTTTTLFLLLLLLLFDSIIFVIMHRIIRYQCGYFINFVLIKIMLQCVR